MADAWPKPSMQELQLAVDLYLRQAYPDGPPPAVRQRVDRVGQADAGALWQSGVFETDKPAGNAAAEAQRYMLRLGNPWYPHMKMVVERSPDGAGYLLRADTHDRHIRPREDSPEYPAFRAMMERNQSLSEAIEAAWISAGLPTFKEFLRRDLERRKSAGGASHFRP